MEMENEDIQQLHRVITISDSESENEAQSVQDDSLDCPDGILIQPWHVIKKQLESFVGKAQPMDEAPMRIEGSHASKKSQSSESSDTLAASRSLDNLSNENAHGNYPISIPHGFQQTHSINHQNSNAPISSILYIPTGTKHRFASMDPHFVHVWRDDKRIKKLDTRRPRLESLMTSVTGITHWVYLPQWSLIALSNSQLELKVLFYSSLIRIACHSGFQITRYRFKHQTRFTVFLMHLYLISQSQFYCSKR